MTLYTYSCSQFQVRNLFGENKNLVKKNRGSILSLFANQLKLGGNEMFAVTKISNFKSEIPLFIEEKENRKSFLQQQRRDWNKNEVECLIVCLRAED